MGQSAELGWKVGLGLALLVAGCQAPQSDTVSSDGKPKVVASTSVLCDLVEQIAEETIDLTCLLEPGQDPHTYEPTPRDRSAIESADLVLYGGYDFEPKIIALVKASNTEAPKVAVYEAAVSEPLMGEAHEHEHGHEEEHGHEHDHEHQHEGEEGDGGHGDDEETVADPHIWHDAEHGIAIVETLRDRMQAAVPEQAETYQEKAAALIAELEQIDAWILQQVETIPTGVRKLVTTHDAFRYYAEAYGFSVAGALGGLSTEEQPSAARLNELIELVEQAKVPAIFAESTTNPQLIETVARDAEVKVAEDSLFVEGPGGPDSRAETYQAMLVANTCTIAIALGGECDPLQ